MPPKPKEPQFERSKYRLKTFGRNTAKKGEVTEAALGEAQYAPRRTQCAACSY